MPDFSQFFSYPGVLRIPAVLFAIVLHEIGHAYVAYTLGDSTAKSEGRFSLNPLRHLDPFGLLMLLLVGFGWAKPVSVDMRYFKNPKKGMALTALAGPMVNFILAFISIVLLSLFTLETNPLGGIYLASGYETLFYLLLFMALINIGLGVFNLIPFPPLDGSKVLGMLLPDRIYYRLLSVENYGMIVLMVLLVTGFLSGPLVALRDAVAGFLTTIAFSSDELTHLLAG